MIVSLYLLWSVIVNLFKTKFDYQLLEIYVFYCFIRLNLIETWNHMWTLSYIIETALGFNSMIRIWVVTTIYTCFFLSFFLLLSSLWFFSHAYHKIVFAFLWRVLISISQSLFTCVSFHIWMELENIHIAVQNDEQQCVEWGSQWTKLIWK